MAKFSDCCSANDTVIKISVMKSFKERLTGAITRPVSPQQGLLFVPGGSVHTCFMQQVLDIVFLDDQGLILSCKERVKPWRFVIAPIRTRYTLELHEGVINKTGLDKGQQIDVNSFI